jgi:hypothetical protein
MVRIFAEMYVGFRSGSVSVLGLKNCLFFLLFFFNNFFASMNMHPFC